MVLFWLKKTIGFWIIIMFVIVCVGFCNALHIFIVTSEVQNVQQTVYFVSLFMESHKTVFY